MIWEFVYFAYQWTLSGKTLGMAVLGIRVVKTDGAPIGARQAVLRTLTLPLSFLVLGPRLPRDPDQPRPVRAARPVGRDGRGLLLGCPGGPAAVVGQAGLHRANLTGLPPPA